MIWRKLLKKFFPLQITKRFYLYMLLLIIVPMIAVGILNYIQFLNERKIERGEKLYTIAAQLDQRLPGSFTEILEQQGALDRPHEEKTRILNEVLQPIINKVSVLYPGVGTGYYSLEFAHVLAVGPELEPDMLVEHVPQDLPYFKVYETGRPVTALAYSTHSWRGKPILYVSYPIYRDGKIIGNTWASIKMKDVKKEALAQAKKMFLTVFLTTVAVIFLSWMFFTRFRRDLEGFASSVVQDSPNLPEGILPELKILLMDIKSRTGQLRLSEEFFSKTFRASPSLISISTLKDARFCNVNDAFLRATGYRYEEVIGRTALELKFWEKRADRNELIKMLVDRGTLRNKEITFLTKSGEARVGLLSAEIIELSGERCVLIMINDITEHKQLQKEMARLDRLNLVGEMAAGIGHEIRNPMTSVRGFLQLLGGKRECLQYKEYFDLMIEELDRANSIITEYLSLAKDRVVDLKVQNLNHLLKVLYPLLQANAIASNNSVAFELEDIPELLLDEKEIRQYVLNIVRNGLEAMSPGGVLRIRTYTDGEEVVFSVQDEGSGIELELLEKIGRPFFTTKENGTGLGLAICYSIAARHNAAIKIETGSAGTTFFLRFKVPKANMLNS